MRTRSRLGSTLSRPPAPAPTRHQLRLSRCSPAASPRCHCQCAYLAPVEFSTLITGMQLGWSSVLARGGTLGSASSRAVLVAMWRSGRSSTIARTPPTTARHRTATQTLWTLGGRSDFDEAGMRHRLEGVNCC